MALSQAALAPIVAGRFIVHGSHDRERLALRRRAIEIDAGEAFGTGYNATTSLCLEAIDTLARRRRFARVLDLGCGTAILGIAAARAWPHARVLAADNDPVATAIACENAHLNRVARRVRVVEAVGFAHPLLRAPRAFDLVLANILARTLIDLAPGMRRAVRPGGIAVLSGLLSDQAREVTAVYRAAGFELVRAPALRSERTAPQLALRCEFIAIIIPQQPRRVHSSAGWACGAGMGVGLVVATVRVFTPPLTPPRQGEGDPVDTRGTVEAACGGWRTAMPFATVRPTFKKHAEGSTTPWPQPAPSTKMSTSSSARPSRPSSSARSRPTTSAGRRKARSAARCGRRRAMPACC